MKYDCLLIDPWREEERKREEREQEREKELMWKRNIGQLGAVTGDQTHNLSGNWQTSGAWDSDLSNWAIQLEPERNNVI